MTLLDIPPFSPNLARDLGEMLAFDFMRHAFVAGGAVALAAGLVGYFVVLRNQVFTADALGHVAFTGGLGGLLLGAPLLGSLYATVIATALATAALGGRGRGRDVAVGTVFAWVLGLGVLFLSIYTTSRSASSGTVGITVLFGSILTLRAQDAAITTVAGLLTSVALATICRPLLFASIDPDVAATRGLPVRLLTLTFLALVGITVAEAVQAVGALLIFGLLVTPAAAASNLTARPYRGMLLSAGLAVAFVWLGLSLSFYIAYPVSFFIIALSSLTYLGTYLMPKPRSRPTPGSGAAS